MRTFKPGQTLIAVKDGELSFCIKKRDKVIVIEYDSTSKKLRVEITKGRFKGLDQIEFASIFTSFPTTRLKRKSNEHV